MNITLLSLLPGALVGVALAIFLLVNAPRTVRAGDAIDRLGEVTVPADTAEPGKGDRVGTWLERNLSGIPALRTSKQDLELVGVPASKLYSQQLQFALIGLIAPLLIPVLFQVILGFFFPLPLILSPVLAVIMWSIPAQNVRARAREARREFTRFVTVYLELVSVALLGNSTPDGALTNAASISDTWVFKRIREEYQIADITRVSKWDALERLGVRVDVPPLIDMARTLRLAEARVGLRDQLRAACAKLRKQVAVADRDAAERITSRMDIPIYVSIAPILALIIVPVLAQLTTV